jgi:hypothetical protein
MIIIIQSAPYESENVLGAIFLATAAVDAGNPTHVYFVNNGLYSILANQNDKNQIQMPSISDLILAQIGSIKFYYIPDPLHPIMRWMPELIPNSTAQRQRSSESLKIKVAGVKPATYFDLSRDILEIGDNLLLF